MSSADIRVILDAFAEYKVATEKRLSAVETELALLRSGRIQWPAVVSSLVAVASLLVAVIVAAATLG